MLNKVEITNKPEKSSAERSRFFSVIPTILGVAFLVGLYFLSRFDYLMFHIVVEAFFVIISVSVFLVIWNTRRFFNNNYFIFLSIALLFVAIVSAAHTLTYRGMNVLIFPDIHPSNLATQLWLASRFLLSLSFFVAILFLNRVRVRRRLIFVGYAIITVLLLLSIFYWRIFPAAFVDGHGLTLFKKVSEYIISALFLSAAVSIYIKRKSFDPSVARLIMASLLVNVAAELAFTLYTDVYGLSNVIGHFFVVISVYFLYRSIVVSGLERPYDLLFRNLKNSEARFKAVVDGQTELICRFLSNGTLTFVNDAYCRYYGLSRKELLGSNLFVHVCEEDLQRDKDNLASLNKENPISVIEMRAIADNCLRWQRWTDKAIFDESGKIVEYQSVGQDITDLKSAEEQLRRSESRYRSLFNSMTEGFALHEMIYDAAGKPIDYRFIETNPAFEKITGLKQEETIGKLRSEVFPDDDPEWMEIYGRVALTGKPVSFSKLSSNFNRFYDIFAFSPAPHQFATLFLDTTERKKAEDELEKSRKLYQAVVEEQSEYVCRYTPDGILTFVNDAYCRCYGKSREELLGSNLYEHILPEDLEVHKKNLAALNPQNPTSIIEHQAETVNGVRWQRWSDRALFNSEGNVVSYQSVGHDITEQREAEERAKHYSMELEKENAEDEALLSSIGDALVAIDRSGKIKFVNKTFEDLVGLELSQIVDRPIDAIAPLSDKNGAPVSYLDRPAGKALETGERIVFSLANDSVFYYGEKKIPLAITTTPIISNGKVTGAISVYRDITNEVELDRAKSEFISVSAHQLRTPLTNISLTAELLLRGASGSIPEEGQAYLRSIVEDIKNMAELINVFLDISRIEMGMFPVNPETVDLVEAINDITDGLMPQLKHKDIGLRKDFVDDLPLINVDKKILRIVFENLLSNAVKYTPAGGAVSMKIEKNASEIVITVSDTGLGVPKGQEGMIFEKMFRATNANRVKAEGLGIGLYVAKSAIEQSGGRIWLAEKKEGERGAAFCVAIPLAGMKKK